MTDEAFLQWGTNLSLLLAAVARRGVDGAPEGLPGAGALNAHAAMALVGAIAILARQEESPALERETLSQCGRLLAQAVKSCEATLQ